MSSAAPLRICLATVHQNRRFIPLALLYIKAYLVEHGIVLMAVPQLPRTYVDGVALRRKDGTPVIGLTLRNDRVDSFWICQIACT